MPIVDVQAKFRELGRIRAGILEKPAGGKARPKKLATWRLTSRWRHLLDELAAVCGGTVREWQHPSEEGAHFELVTETDALDVIVPPGDVLSQWYELWSGGGCQRRCDGVRQTLVDAPCSCPSDPQERAELAGKNPPKACKPTSRLIVMLPMAGDLGVWRLESHGYYAAVELAGAAGLVELATRRGIMVPAVLRLEQRVIKRPGQPPKRFAVPALSFRGNLGETLDALGFARGDLPVLPHVEARPALDVGGVPELPAAPAPIPTPAELVELDEYGVEHSVEKASIPDGGPPEPDVFVPPPPDPEPEHGGGMTWPQMAAMRAGEAGLGDDERHGLYLALTAGRTGKGADLAPMERHSAMAAFVRVKRGEAVLARGAGAHGGPVWALIGRGTGIEHASERVSGAVDLTIVAGPADLIGSTRRFSAPERRPANAGPELSSTLIDNLAWWKRNRPASSPQDDPDGPVVPEIVDGGEA